MTREEMERDAAPAPPETPSRRPARDAKPPVGAPSLPRVVHIIGESDEIQDLLGVLISRHPETHVRCFTSGEAFLDRLGERGQGLEPGVVLLDFDLPGMQGLDILTRIRCFANPFPVIIRSHRHAIAHAVEAMKLGALDFLEKGHDPKSLFAAIEDGFGIIEARALIERQRNARPGDGDDAPADRAGRS